MDAGPPLDSRETRRSRVSSPSAANTEAGSRSLARAGKVSSDVLELAGPARVVLPVRLGPATDGDLIEARLGDGESSALRNLFQLEYHQRHRLGWIHVRIATRLPAPGKEPLRVHFLDDNLKGQVLVLGDGDRAPRCLARSEAAGQTGAEPLAELGRIGKGLPHPGPGSPQDDALLDLVGTRPAGRELTRAHRQPPGCAYNTAPLDKMQPIGCPFYY